MAEHRCEIGAKRDSYLHRFEIGEGGASEGRREKEVGQIAASAGVERLELIGTLEELEHSCDSELT